MYTQASEHQHCVVLERGEKIIASLTAYAGQQRIRASSITGLGAIKDVEVAYYSLEEKRYFTQLFAQGDYELVGASGTIAIKQGLAMPHVHIVFSDTAFQVFGGHLVEATCAVTVELHLATYPFSAEREYDAETGLDLICRYSQ